MQEGVAKHAAEAQHKGTQDSEGRQPAVKVDQSSNTAQRAGSHEDQRQPASDASQVDEHAHDSAPPQPVSAAAMEFTDTTEKAAGARAADPHTAGSRNTAAHGNKTADHVSVPDRPAVAPVLYTTDVSEEVSGVSAPIHFTDGSEATVVSARGVTVQVRLLLLCVSLRQIGP